MHGYTKQPDSQDTTPCKNAKISGYDIRKIILFLDFKKHASLKSINPIDDELLSPVISGKEIIETRSHVDTY
jgi:hypothetical protein